MFTVLTGSLAIGTTMADLWAQVRGDTRLLLWAGFLQVAFIFAAWAAARGLVPRREMNSFGQYDRREGGGLARSIALYLAYAGLLALVLFVFRFTSADFQLGVLDAITQPRHAPMPWIAAASALGLGAIVVALALPMLVFRIRFWRAVVLLLFILILLAASAWLLDRATGRPASTRLQTLREWAAAREGGVFKSLANRAQENLAFDAAEKKGNDPARPMDERKAAVRSLFEQLEEIRKQLPEDDAEAVAEYNRKNARYEALLQRLKAELAGHPGTP